MEIDGVPVKAVLAYQCLGQYYLSKAKAKAALEEYGVDMLIHPTLLFCVKDGGEDVYFAPIQVLPGMLVK